MPAGCGVSKNMQTKGQVDKDSWHGLFDTQAGPAVVVSRLSGKRADTVGESTSTF